MKEKNNWIASCLILIILGLTVGKTNVHADTLFSENFEGYSSFPDQNPSGDFINAGIPKTSEGAVGKWYGGRFETPDNGTIDSDLAVQKFGGGTNNTHTGRFADDAGLLFNISTLGYQDVKLSFDYRTFLAESTDRIVAGYYLGELNFGTCAGNGESGCYRDFLNQDFGGNQGNAENWWSTQWTQILSDRDNSWKSLNDVALPSNQEDIWVAFWLDNGNGDFGKIDNIKVLANVVPEPISSALYLIGGGTLTALRLKRKQHHQSTNNISMNLA